MVARYRPWLRAFRGRGTLRRGLAGNEHSDLLLEVWLGQFFVQEKMNREKSP